MFRIRFSMKRPEALAERVERIRRLHQLRRVLAEIQLPLHTVAGALPDAKIDRLNPSIQ
jgi:predicted component of type VI protein secretion system